MLLRAKQQLGAEQFARLVQEVPLRRWTHQRGSKIALLTPLAMLRELLVIRRRYCDRD